MDEFYSFIFKPDFSWKQALHFFFKLLIGGYTLGLLLGLLISVLNHGTGVFVLLLVQWKGLVKHLFLSFPIYLLAAFCTALSYLCILRLSIRAGDAGLAGRDAWGKIRHLEWKNIASVRPANLWGLKYLRVFGPDCRRPIWVPLFLKNRSGFARTVKEKAGPDSPLLKYL